MANNPTSTTRQVQEQGLHLKLSPLQMLYTRLLEMTTPEIEEEVNRRLDDNPALEVDEDDGAPSGEAEEKEGRRDDGDDGSEEQYVAPDDYGDRRDDDIADVMNDYSARKRAGAELPDLQTVTQSEPESLYDYLKNQLSELSLSAADRDIASLIIGNLDSNGFMTRTIDAITDDAAMQLGLEVSADHVRELWREVRKLDPAGIGAVDLRDSLLLQLERRTPTEAVDDARRMIANYFDLFSRRRFDILSREMGLSSQRLAAAEALIKSLYPKPGTLVGGSGLDRLATEVTPDFIVTPDGNSISLTMPDNIPALNIEESFRVADEPPASASPRQREAYEFYRHYRDDAHNFIRAVKMRRETLYNVMRAIIRLQPDFFMSGGDRSELRPMILKDVAEIVGRDVSVVSRASSGKYVATPLGVYSLKSLFSERSGSKRSADKNAEEDGGASAEQTIAAIRKIIENEDPQHPLSDDAIGERLRSAGVAVARRTVAKYREKAGIPIARLRRQLPTG